MPGLDLIYKLECCGAFQAGGFSAGQIVEYRASYLPPQQQRIQLRLRRRHGNKQAGFCAPF